MARPRKDEQIDIPEAAVAAVIALLDSSDSGDAADVTLALVAERIGCRPPALYNHFVNRDDLLRRAHDEGFARLYAAKLAVAARTAGAPALDRLRAGGLAYVRFALAHPGLYRLMFAPPPQADLEGNPFERDVGRRCLDFLTESIAACQREGHLVGLPAERIAFVLWSMVHGAASLILQDRAPLAAKARSAAAAPMPAESAADVAVDTIMALMGATSR